MKNNINEETDIQVILGTKKLDPEAIQKSESIKEAHRGLLQALQLPPFLTELQCPFCKEKLTLRSIRGLNFKTNAKNIGDLCVDFHCESCGVGDNLYLRRAFSSVADIINIVVGRQAIDVSAAIVEEDMYKMVYNNTAEKMSGG